jgi:hypothetical protein
MRSRLLLASLAAVFTAAAPDLPAQNVSVAGCVNLVGVGNGNAADPFGLAVSPDGFLYVAVAGSPSPTPTATNNDVVLRIDPISFAILDQITVGLFPEEIVFTEDAPGDPRHGFVSVNSDAWIAAFDADPSSPTFATVLCQTPHPSGPYAAFGLAVKPDQSIVYVGDFFIGNSVHAVDADPASPTFCQFLPLLGLPVPGAHGRLAFAGNTLLVPSQAFGAMTTGFFSTVDLSGPTPLVTSACLLASATTFPGPQDVAAHPNGTAFVTGFDFPARVYAFDAPTSHLLRTVWTGLGNAQQGIGIHPNGSIVAVTDLVANRIHLFDGNSHRPLAEVNLNNFAPPAGCAPFSGPNDVVFIGSRMYVTLQFSEAVLVLENLPGPVAAPYVGTLSTSTGTPAIGTSVTFDLVAPMTSIVVGILVSASDVPTPILGNNLYGEIGLPVFVLSATAGPVLSTTVTIPNDPALACVNVFAQGVAFDGGFSLTNPVAVVLQ